MKKIIMVIIISIMSSMYVNADWGWVGFSILSFSREINEEKDISNFSIGHEIMLVPPNTLLPIILSPNIKWGNENVIMDLYCIIIPPLKYWILLGEGRGGWYTYGIGANISYNFTENIFGISPLIELTYWSPIPIIKFHLTYKYNVYFLSDNSHEIAFKISLMDFFTMTRQ